jgi:hypothetical protein
VGNADLPDAGGDMIDDQPTYSPEVQDYINRIQALSPSMGGFHLAPQYSQYSEQVQEPASDSYDTVTHYVDPRDYQSAIAAGTDPQNLYGADIRDWGGARTSTGWNPVQLMLGNNYRLTDKTSGKTFDASTPDQIRQMIAQTNALSGVGGNNTASWDVSQVNPDGTLTSKATDTPYTPSFLKQAGQGISDAAVHYLAPALASYFLGPAAAGYFGTTALAGSALAAGGASALQAGAEGHNLQDSLLTGLQSGVGNYVGGSLSAAYGSGLSGRPFDPSMSFLDRLASFGGSGGISFPEAGLEAAHVVAPSSSFLSGLGNVSLAGLGAIPSFSEGTPDAPPDPNTEKVTVTGYHPPVGGGLPAVPTGFAPNSTEEVNVSDFHPKPKDVQSPDIAGDAAAILAAGGIAATAGGLGGSAAETSGTSDLSKGLTAAKYAALLASLLGGAGAAGSGNNTGSSTYSSSLANPQKLPDIFHASLGSGTGGLGGAGSAPGTSANRTQLDPQTDWNTYGERPELPFFSDIPKRMAHGGALPTEHDAAPRQSFAVNGAGDGRSDSIPAKLSDGEYVMDAETVSLLGNGSNKAGAHQLDQFRVNLRKHKGAELAKGRFSVNAKNPQAYMAGGNT